MLKFALTILIGAFLLFQVQPLVGRVILPWHGGTATVWTTCLLFFQLALLVGYLYSHFLATRVRADLQGIVHAVFLAASLLLLPLSADVDSVHLSNPTLAILVYLARHVGLMAIMLAATSPLLAKWYERSQPRVSAYRLYAISNLGSLLALASYPFLVEPLLTLGAQTTVWSWCYVAFVAGSIWSLTGSRAAAAGITVASASGPADATGKPNRPALWIGLSCAGSTLLLATTNQLCQEIAVVPLLWIAPLAIYLTTFVLCFENPRWYHRRLCVSLLVILILPTTALLYAGARMPILIQIGIYSATLFAGCMTCHGELVRSRPNTRQLTGFYLAVSVGGACGGLLVAVVAPILFRGYWEYHLAIAGVCSLTAIATAINGGWSFRRSVVARQLVGIGMIALLVVLGAEMYYGQFRADVVRRNFYGTLRVAEGEDKLGTFRRLAHGRIDHGVQYLDAARKNEPTLYFARNSAVDFALNGHPRREKQESLRVGVVGLGVGTIAAYGRTGDVIRFYELNPEVERLCREHFTFVKDSKAQVDVVLGDARVSLERELDREERQDFDVFVVDAFRNDAIPLHLLTRECAATYFQHLRPDGLILFHISNRFLDLAPVVRGLAAEFDCEALRLPLAADEESGAKPAEWIVVTSNQRFLRAYRDRGRPWTNDDRAPRLWTDDFAAIWQVLK